MRRTTARMALGVLLLSLLLACSCARRSPNRSRQPTLTPTIVAPTPVADVPTATATASPTEPPAPSATPTGRLPQVVARVSISVPEGDAYGPQMAAFDETGRAVVLCDYYGQPGSPTSALMVLQPGEATRGPALALPGHAIGALATAGGRAYAGYEDSQYKRRLVAVDLATGKVLADVPADGLYLGRALAADSAGHLYVLSSGQLEVRDPATLQVTRSIPLPDEPGPRTLALDCAHERLYLALGSRLQAYRVPDITPLWESMALGSEIRGLTVDRTGERVYARCERYETDGMVVQLRTFGAEAGQALDPVPPPSGTTWSLLAADTEMGYLLFAEPGQDDTRLWQTDPNGQPLGAETRVSGYMQFAAGCQYLLALDSQNHLVHIYADGSLEQIGRVITGAEIRHLVVDSAGQRVYFNDSAGRLHLVDSEGTSLLPCIEAGSGALTLDAPNNQLFVGREPWGDEIAVVDTGALTVTAVITGGYQVAVDSAGRRAFVGYTAAGPADDDVPGEVQVWDTETFQHLGVIAHRGEPTYNPLRNEIYLRDYSAYIVDGETLAVTGELTPEVSDAPMRWCNGCPAVQRITVDPEQELVVVGMTVFSAGKGPGSLPQPQVFSARTLQPLTHPATILTSLWGDEGPFIIPADAGQVYEAEHYARYVVYNGVTAYPANSPESTGYRDGLSLDLYLPGRHVALSAQQSCLLAYDPRNWELLGWIPYQPIHAVDLAGRRLYAWERSLLTILSFDGGEPMAPEPPKPWPGGAPLHAISEIHFSPDYARDHTLFVATAGQVLRSTDGGASWTLLGGLPPASSWGPPDYTLALSPAYGEDHTLFLGVRAGESLGLGVWRSTDSGDTWMPVWQGLEDLRVERLAVSPEFAQDRTVLAYAQYQHFWEGDSGRSLFRSSDGGASWAREATEAHTGDTTQPLPEPEALLPYPAQTVQFQLGDYGQALQRSADGGSTWQTVLHSEEPGLLPVVLSPAFQQDGQAFAVSPHAVYWSGDGGLTWQVSARPSDGPYLTALAVALGADGQPVLALGDREGTLSVVAPAELTWAPANYVPPTPTAAPPPATPCAGGVERLGPWQQDQIGCPEAAPQELYMASQFFEHGLMIWLSDQREVLVLTSDGEANRWQTFPDTWQEGQPDHDPALQPPNGLQQPIRGFGKVWREELGGPQAVIGWAIGSEQGYDGRRQLYSGGTVVTAPDGTAYALLADGTWVSE